MQVNMATSKGREPAADKVKWLRDLQNTVRPIHELKDALAGVEDADALEDNVQAAFDQTMRDVAAAPLFGVYPSQLVHKAVIELVGRGITAPELLAPLPDAMIAAVHQTVLQSHENAHHVLMGPRDAGGNPTPGSGMRLAQIDSDSALGMMFCDVGIIDFWIDEADLVAGNWDAAWAATAGG